MFNRATIGRPSTPNTFSTNISPPPTPSRTKAESLGDLHQFRQILLRSSNPAANKIGTLLNDIQEILKNGETTADQHRAQCDVILDMAEILNSEEYVIVCDDLMIQRHPQKGVLALSSTTPQSSHSQSSPQAARSNMQSPSQQAGTSHGTYSPPLRRGVLLGSHKPEVVNEVFLVSG